MSEPNKRHNRKIWRSCPVCKGKVCVAQRNGNWWVYCVEDRTHIRQKFFSHAHEAIEAWNVKANKQTNADRIRSMTDEEMAEFICYQIIDRNIGIPPETWLDWLKQECET